MTVFPYETSLTALFTAFGEYCGFMEKISPAINDWILAKIPLEKQRVMDRRLRKCKRICRRGMFNEGMVLTQVRLDFSDEPPQTQADIANLLFSEIRA